MTDLLRSMWRRALIAVFVISVTPAASRAAGTPECPQIITGVAGNVFTEPGDVDCNRSIGLTDFALFVQAQFCDPCKS
jgi:hypothetical protein